MKRVNFIHPITNNNVIGYLKDGIITDAQGNSWNKSEVTINKIWDI